MMHTVLVLCAVVLFSGLASVQAAETVTVQSVDHGTPQVAESFAVSASLTHAVYPGTYFLKCRIGGDITHLTEGQTYNTASDTWLDDSGANGAWILMPQVTTDSTGSWSGTLACRVKATAASGTKQVYVRACLNTDGSCGASFQSGDFREIQVLALPPTPTVLPTIMPTLKPSPTASPQPTPQKTPKPAPSHTGKPPAIGIHTPVVPTERVLTDTVGGSRIGDERTAFADTPPASDTASRVLSSATQSGDATASVIPGDTIRKQIAGILLVVALVCVLTAVAFVWQIRSANRIDRYP